MNSPGVLSITGYLVWFCPTLVGEIRRAGDSKHIGPVDGAGGDLIGDGLAHRPYCPFYISGENMFRIGIVNEQNFNLCAIGKGLGNHHESLCIGNKSLVGTPRNDFIQ